MALSDRAIMTPSLDLRLLSANMTVTSFSDVFTLFHYDHSHITITLPLRTVKLVGMKMFCCSYSVLTRMSSAKSTLLTTPSIAQYTYSF